MDNSLANAMDRAKLIEALSNTTAAEAEKRSSGEAYLEQVQKIVTFVPSLLEICVSDEQDGAVRQAAAIYMKNMITKHWEDQKDEATDPSMPHTFTIYDQDKQFVRGHIVQAMVLAADPIRLQLGTCIQNILREDFPEKWPTFADQVLTLLQSTDGPSCLAALLVLYRLVKIYEYRKAKEKAPLSAVMKGFLPLLFERLCALLPNESQESVFLQKMILKIFYALVQHSLSFDMITKEDFLKWMHVVLKIVERPVPEETKEVDEEERSELVWWKCKKWCAHLMARVFERYGAPGQMDAQYNQFTDFYLKQIGPQSINTMLSVLHAYHTKQYVSPRVLHYALNYLTHGVSHASMWKHVKPHVTDLVRNVVFPLVKHSEEDEECWNEDVLEYIRNKYDIFDDLMSPSSAAMSLLCGIVKRGQLLKNVVAFIIEVLNKPTSHPLDVDGAMHMIGGIATNLIKKQAYRKDLEQMLISLVLPRAQCEHRFLRARACWVIQSFSEAPFKNRANLEQCVQRLVHILLHDTELPVRLEAAMALQMLLNDQEPVEDMLRPVVRDVVLCVLKMISETENDDLTSVMEKLIESYMDEIKPVAVEVATELANVFHHFLTNDEFSEDRALTAMGILTTLESILNVMEEHKEIMVHLEGVVLTIINTILEHSVMGLFGGLNFYEEVLSLVASLTTSQISSEMWRVFYLLNEMFKNEGIDFFTDFMHPLHNYVTVDTEAFLSVPDRLPIVLDMCTQVLTTDQGDEAQTHAAKLLECMVLQCRGRIDAYIHPIMQLAFARLAQDVHTSELRAMLLQIIIASLYYNLDLAIGVMQKLSVDPSQQVLDKFIRMWLYDTDCFLGIHDRKICVIGLTLLITAANRPSVLAESDIHGQIMPSCLMLFDGLERAYHELADLKKQEDEEDEGDDDSDIEEGDDGLESDEDEIDDAQLDYMERLNRQERDSGHDGSESSSSIDEDGMFEATDLEAYETPLDGDEAEMDEFQLFRQAMQHIQEHDMSWYQQLTHALSDSQQKQLQKVMQTADQRRKLQESKKIEKSGGYQFNVHDPVPTSFNFSSP